LHLEHIVEDLLAGMTVEGVPGIGADGAELAPTRRHRARRRGALLLGASGLVLLAEAVVAGGLAAGLLYAWTAVGLGLFFVGGYLVMLRE
jgi:type IV secretory pathway TrbD component